MDGAYWGDVCGSGTSAANAAATEADCFEDCFAAPREGFSCKFLAETQVAFVRVV